MNFIKLMYYSLSTMFNCRVLDGAEVCVQTASAVCVVIMNYILCVRMTSHSRDEVLCEVQLENLFC
jgi:hypothetical protein